MDDEPVDVEIQRADKGAGVKRARYNISLMDANTLVKGEEYDKLPECYCIFTTENDVMSGGMRDDPVGRLMHDFSCSNPSDMYYQQLARQVKYYKKDEKGVEAMSRGMEELIDMEKREIA